MLTRLLSGILVRGQAREAAAARERGDQALQLITAAEAGHHAGDLQGAEALCRQALDADASLLRGWQLLGVLCARRGRLDEAQSHLEHAITLDPDNAISHSDLGQVHRLAGSWAQAEPCLRRALALDPGLGAARIGLVQLLAQQGSRESAIRTCREQLDHPPVPGEILRVLVELLDGLGRHGEARAACEAVLGQEPSHVQAHASLGFLLVKRVFDPEAGLEHLTAALAQTPEDPALHVTRAIALRDLARIDESIDACNRALSWDSGNAMALFHRAIARLLKRDFEGGWPDYEARLASDVLPRRTFPYPRWNGEDLGGRTILVHAEQGLGDEIMFASCVNDLAGRAGHVMLECSPKLVALFARSFPAVTVTSASRTQGAPSMEPLPAPRFVTPAGSLPLHFRRSAHAFKGGKPYLRADARLSEEYRRRIEALGPGAAVGLSWRGGTIESRRALRSLDPRQLFPALDRPNLHLISLQYDASAEEVEQLARAHGRAVHHWQDAIDDYDRTAALVSALDLVISVCTAVVHLGGALGCPVWVAAHRSPEWRYGIEGESMPWYGSVRIFRQDVAGDWTPVIERISAAIARGELQDRSACLRMNAGPKPAGNSP